jgi:hypothetical protein
MTKQKNASADVLHNALLQILENIRCKIQCMMEHTGHFHLCFNGQ